MNQDNIFLASEGDNWFRRNMAVMGKEGKIDWPCFLIKMLEHKETIESVIELGCSNGYRLARVKEVLTGCTRCVGVDASKEAIENGLKNSPEIDLHTGLLSAVPVDGTFDLAIVNYVLHWVDRSSLGKSIAEIDRLVSDGGLLVLGDFLPDFPQRRRYHHLETNEVYTYKQDYAKIFEAMGTYKEIARFTYDHDSQNSYALKAADSGSRGSCVLLRKSLQGYYPEV